MRCHHRMCVAIGVSVAFLIVLSARGEGFNPQPEPPGMWYTEGYIDMWSDAIDATGEETPFGIDPAIVGDGAVDFEAGVIARFNAPTTADDKPADGVYDVVFEHFSVRIGDTTWDQTMPSSIQFQVLGGVVIGCAGSYTVTMPEHPDLSFALPASPGTWAATDERDRVNLGVVTGTYSLRDGIVPTGQPGDADGDGDVDLDDFVILKTEFCKPTSTAMATSNWTIS